MKKKCRDFCFIALITVCIGILAYINSKWFLIQPEGENTSPVSLKKTLQEDKITEDNYAIEVPDSWHEEIDSKNKIDAKIVVSKVITKQGFRKAMAQTVTVRQEQVLNLLEEYYRPYKGTPYDDVIQYRGKDNMYLYFQKEQSYGTSLYSSMADYISMAYRDGLTDRYNREQYAVGGELEGFPIEECNEKIRELCNAVGISGEIKNVSRALDYRTMEANAVELHMDGPDTKPDYEWKPSDNSYYCTISQLCNEIPVIPTYLVDSYADILNAGAHVCVLNHERFISFYFDEIYKIEYAQDYEKLMGFSEVMDRYRQCVNLTLQDFDTQITDITMCVIAVERGEKSYEMVPIWIFCGSWYDSVDDITGPHVIILNAVTGEKL